MELRFTLIALVCSVLFPFPDLHGQHQIPGNTVWNQLLSKHVNIDGWVNYHGFIADQHLLEKYLDQLSEHMPDSAWSSKQELTYWINVYNAYTIKLIIDHYPVKSIRDIDQPWDRKFVHLGGKEYSLNQIEHEIIRKEFDEPRIHFALVCAAFSCPPLLNEAYIPDKLDEQLEHQGQRFINNPEKNKIEKTIIRVSQIFNWYKDDFTKNGSLISYLNQFTETQIASDAKVDFLEYDWGLNGN